MPQALLALLQGVSAVLVRQLAAGGPAVRPQDTAISTAKGTRSGLRVIADATHEQGRENRRNGERGGDGLHGVVSFVGC